MSEIRPAHPGGRRMALLLLLGTAALGTVLLLTADRYSEPLRDWIVADPDEAPRRLRLVFIGFAAAASAPLLIFAVYVWRLAAHIVRTAQFPPPGYRVLRDTPVIEGSAALARARALKIFAACIAMGAVLFWVLLWRLAGLLRPVP